MLQQSEKLQRLQRMCDERGIISALAIDQRGALKRMMGESISRPMIEEFKTLVAKELTPYASSILLDPEFGFPAAAERAPNSGLLMAYEKTGYDKTVAGRYPDLIDDVSVKRLKAKGADAVKLLIYVDVDESSEINDRKEAFVERVASECQAEQLPLFLEILTYDHRIHDEKAEARKLAELKPHKVIEAMRIYSAPRFGVDVLKVEVPVNMRYVEGFGDDPIFSQAEAAGFFQAQSEATHLPFIFLSAGVSAELFRQTLQFAHQSGSRFNGVLCGRATWAGGAETYKNAGVAAAKNWFASQGVENIQQLAAVLAQTATPIHFTQSQ